MEGSRKGGARIQKRGHKELERTREILKGSTGGRKEQRIIDWKGWWVTGLIAKYIYQWPIVDVKLEIDTIDNITGAI